MGNSCGCLQPDKSLTPRFQMGEIKLSTSRHSDQKNKFDDICHSDPNDEQLSQLDLNILNRNLSRCLIRFQQQNGVITKRFTKRTIRSQQNFGKQLPQFTIQQEDKQNNEGNPNQNEFYLPLENQNINLEVRMSEPSENQAYNEQQQSCLISLQSHILNNSLFTDRQTGKKQFYRIFNRISDTQLLEWKDQSRVTYEFYQQELTDLVKYCSNQAFLVCIQALHLYWVNSFIHLISINYDPCGIKIYSNGIKKLFPLTFSKQPTLMQIYQSIFQKIVYLDLSILIFFFTGWIPQQIKMNEIKNFTGIFQRLSNNFNQGNAIITFTRRQTLKTEYTCLTKIDFNQGNIHMSTGGLRSTIPDVLLQHPSENKEIIMKFQNFVEVFDIINLNWNPFIYEQSVSREGIIHQKNEIKKYILVIPPSSNDLEIRIFLEKHNNYTIGNKSKFSINLYDYQGANEINLAQSIRTIQTQQQIYSDVFIFQSCNEKTQYLLTVQVINQLQFQQPVYFTITLHSFAEMRFKQVETKPILKEISLSTQILPQNNGFGINSPYFNKNLQFGIETSIGKQIQIIINVSSKLTYQICLIPDPEKKQNVTRLKLEHIINQSKISAQKKGNGSFMVKTQHRNYLLMINSYSAQHETIQIKLNLFGSLQLQPILNIQRLNVMTNITFQQQIRWLPNHSGPRKRLKSNTTNTYQPTKTFTQFFKNPLIDKTLIKGTYQFYIKNQTFREYFDSVESYQDKNTIEPPALSMAVFKASDNKKQFKIIIDDAYYVPFGVGFWSAEIGLEEGSYRFVFPKMDKGFSKGSFGIIKC